MEVFIILIGICIALAAIIISFAFSTNSKNWTNHHVDPARQRDTSYTLSDID